jgi:hypothetical protein
MMKRMPILLLPVLLLAGCVTMGTIESRKTHAAAYAALAPDAKTLVDHGQIGVGKTTDESSAWRTKDFFSCPLLSQGVGQIRGKG